ncbi:MAG: VOC family protein [Pseudomonadota bacterium]
MTRLLASEHSSAATLGLTRMDQVGLVYRDIEAAIAMYEPVFGPFELLKYGEMEWDYYGEPEVSEIYIALGNSGNIEIELIQWVSGKTPHKDFIDTGQEGLQHIRYRVDDLDAVLQLAEQQQYQAIWEKRFAPGLAAAYLARDGDPLVLELFENTHNA